MLSSSAPPAASPPLSPGQPARIVPREYLVPFLVILLLFPLWGFAHDLTNPMVKAFTKILNMTNFQGSLVQCALYGGYFAMALPAAIFIKRFTYKSGVLLGLGLYATGAFLFIPASMAMSFGAFLVAYFIMACGMSFLETTANPYVLAMGAEDTSTVRLNVAQAFNPIGSLCGMLVASKFVLSQLSPVSQVERAALPADQLAAVTSHDLAIIRTPYLVVGFAILTFLLVIAFLKMPRASEGGNELDLRGTFARLLRNRRYVEGVVAQFFYMGAQIGCWTFILQYGTELFTSQGMLEKAAEVRSQNYNMIAMIIFIAGRIICTLLLRFVSPGGLLMALAASGAGLVLGTIFLQGIVGLWCLVAVSACMSLMFPTIYGIALRGLGDDAKIGAAGLIMAILGGSILPPLQALIMDQKVIQLGSFALSAVRASFMLPLVCFLVVALFGWRTLVDHRQPASSVAR